MNGNDLALVRKKFEAMGARARLELSKNAGAQAGPVVIDIRRDRQGEFYDVSVNHDLDRLVVLDLQPRERHLLLMAEAPEQARPVKHKFLCGHDERAWFVAAVPGNSASTVDTAMDALKPAAVTHRERQAGVRGRAKYRRKNDAFVRQGEWFFVPRPDLIVTPAETRHDELLLRSNVWRSKPHIAQFAYRGQGETVYLHRQSHRMISEAAYARMKRKSPEAAMKFVFRPTAFFVRGTVRHPDHKTIMLRQWHEVLMNLENLAPSRRHVIFVD